MGWRVFLAVAYGCALGGTMALENLHPGMSDAPLLVLWLAAPVVGFLVGRWWVLLAVAGLLIGRTIGWDPAENDGNPSLWWPYLVSSAVLLGLPLLGGAMLAAAYERRRRRASEADMADADRREPVEG